MLDTDVMGPYVFYQFCHKAIQPFVRVYWQLYLRFGMHGRVFLTY